MGLGLEENIVWSKIYPSHDEKNPTLNVVGLQNSGYTNLLNLKNNGFGFDIGLGFV